MVTAFPLSSDFASLSSLSFPAPVEEASARDRREFGAQKYEDTMAGFEADARTHTHKRQGCLSAVAARRGQCHGPAPRRGLAEIACAQ